MRWAELLLLIISFVFLYTPIIQAAEEPHITLRSSYRDLSVFQVQSISNIFILNNHNKGFYGHSTIIHRYEEKSINGDSVVIDHATGMMWHQSGSDKDMEWNKAKQWVRDLNSRGYAGYYDWRLPTVEEAASLLESSKKNGDLYIDTVFDIKQSGIWTGDENDTASYLDGAWNVRFSGGYGGYVCWHYDNASNYVRPVRSMK
ncbi:MAG: hypothetical protein SCARUB_01657 [Candidatus Scalindua rubra]|uniref:Lcl C-terminal domain-containing protein n=1 Tax=Candidatus Scalindua rubra TaxID=1872076 RepID=A0A1E3XC45_9BACT|nr:MAG: hypothetical protein SCARUB_01657 [Candidatus Scalindua rubra]